MASSVLRVMFMHFPKRLAAIRKERNLTQQQMAQTIGIHVSQYKRYEAGASQPTLEVFRKITLALNVSADELLFESNERGPGDHENLRLQFEAVAQLDSKEQAVVMELIDGMLLKHDAKRWLQARS